MKLKTRIIISFFIIVLEPLLFTVLAFCFFSHYQFRAIEKQYGIENPTYETLANTAEMIARLTNKAAENIEETANTDPERFTDIQYLDSLNKFSRNSYCNSGIRCLVNQSHKLRTCMDSHSLLYRNCIQKVYSLECTV